MTDRSIASLYTSLNVRLKHFILSRVRDEDAANDILQDVFLKIHSKLGTLKDETKLESWIFQITRNAIADYFRNTKTTVDVADAPEPSESPADEDPNECIVPYIKELVESLPEPYRAALKLVEYEGVSQKDMAERLGLSFSGAKSRVQRARKMIKELMFECCHFEFDRYGTIIDYHPISCSCCSEAPTDQ